MVSSFNSSLNTKLSQPKVSNLICMGGSYKYNSIYLEQASYSSKICCAQIWRSSRGIPTLRFINTHKKQLFLSQLNTYKLCGYPTLRMLFLPLIFQLGAKILNQLFNEFHSQCLCRITCLRTLETRLEGRTDAIYLVQKFPVSKATHIR